MGSLHEANRSINGRRGLSSCSFRSDSSTSSSCRDATSRLNLIVLGLLVCVSTLARQWTSPI